MRIQRQMTLLAMVTALTACGAEDAKIDEALRQDLSLASQPYMPQPYMSPLEAGYAQGYGPYGYAPQQRYPQAPYGYQPAVARSSGTIRRAPSTASAGTSGGGRVIKQTKRDAAIGAAAGAAIGAVTAAKKDRVKNAVLGAAIGAVLGGVYGNNVDVKRIP
jgi:phosphotransferase system  glucose/maltose/N-acetylglucosamine-specific IIC component